MPDKHERVRQRAHELWEREGRPDGSEARHWAEAERQIEADSAAAPMAAAPVKKAAGRPPKVAAVSAPAPAMPVTAPKRTAKALTKKA